MSVDIRAQGAPQQSAVLWQTGTVFALAGFFAYSFLTTMSNVLRADASGTTPPPQRDDRFPSGIPFIVGNEAAERFSFYGMRAILYVYLTGLFSNFVAEAQIPADAKVHATQVYHLFMAGSYLSPMIGAILADRLLGKFRVILWISLFYVVGHGALAVAGGRFLRRGSRSLYIVALAKEQSELAGRGQDDTPADPVEQLGRIARF